MQELLLQETADVFIKNDIISAIFSNPIKKNNKVRKIKIRKIILKNIEQYQVEFFEDKKTLHKNIMQKDISNYIVQFFSEFKNVKAESNYEQFVFMQNNKKTIRFSATKLANLNNMQCGNKNILHLDHDKQKNYLLSMYSSLTFLKKLHFVNSENKIIPSMYNKFRQINRYLEFIDLILPELKNILLNKNKLYIIDFGCGKAYLTFALYYYLTELKNISSEICGLDLKQDVIEFCNTLSKECEFDSLYFKEGNIHEFEFDKTPDMVISLHACNIATDLAIAKAIKNNTKIIFEVPCCQHEINTQIRNNIKKIENPINAMFDYGIITEKFSSLLTDVLRAKLLETFGYKVSVEEFIDTEHTPKNILIKAIKMDKNQIGFMDYIQKAKKQFVMLKESFFVEPYLEKLLYDI